jgi:hypothetical protein
LSIFTVNKLSFGYQKISSIDHWQAKVTIFLIQIFPLFDLERWGPKLALEFLLGFWVLSVKLQETGFVNISVFGISGNPVIARAGIVVFYQIKFSLHYFLVYLKRQKGLALQCLLNSTLIFFSVFFLQNCFPKSIQNLRASQKIIVDLKTKNMQDLDQEPNSPG